MKKTKALALLSGGLDSTLAVKLILERGIEVEAINFVTPFCPSGKDGCSATEVAKTLNIPLKTVNTGTDYLRIIRKPKFGYGKNMNPCIDCRIFMLKKAKQHAKTTGAALFITGEVLGQRPMSQHRAALDLIEKETKLKGKILRPLSAKLLPKTEAQEKGLITEKELMGIHGRSRKKQIETAKQLNITKYPCAAGGCLLTDKEFATKLRDLFQHKRKATTKDVELLKVGRHFRTGENKIVVGRNETENEVLLKTKKKTDYYFEVPDCGSPTTILQGPKTKEAIQKAAELTAFHSDNKSEQVQVKYGKNSLNKTITIRMLTIAEVNTLRLH